MPAYLLSKDGQNYPLTQQKTGRMWWMPDLGQELKMSSNLERKNKNQNFPTLSSTSMYTGRKQNQKGLKEVFLKVAMDLKPQH